MAYVNDNYLKLKAGYLFPEIARRVREFCDKQRGGIVSSDSLWNR